MYQQPSRKFTILFSQAAIVIISLISTLFRQYYFVAIILYTIILFIIMSYATMKKVKPKPEDLKNPIFREKNAMKIAMHDKELSKELMRQVKTTMISFATLPLIFVLFPLYMNYISPIVEEALSTVIDNEVAVRFLNFLMMYEFVFGVISLVRYIISLKVKPFSIMLPHQYTVYKTGVYADNRLFIRFSEDQCFLYNPKRMFIDILSPKNPGARIRLYSEEIWRLKEKLEEKGILRECRLE